MRLKFKIQRSLRWKSNFDIHIQEEKFDIWYKEVLRRFKELYNLETEEAKQEFMKKYPCFDIDESMWVWIMSPEHFQAMDKFLFSNAYNNGEKDS